MPAGENGHDDLHAVIRVLNGDESAFAWLVRKYEPFVRRLARSFLVNRDGADDACQEIFLRVYRQLRQFDLTRPFKPWFTTVALNVLRRSYRQSVRRREVVEEFARADPESSSDPADEVVRDQEAELVDRCIAALPRTTREPVILYYLHEMSVDEVSESLHLSREAVKSRLHRARRLLRELLTQEQRWPPGGSTY